MAKTLAERITHAGNEKWITLTEESFFLEIAARLDTQERAIEELRKHVASVPDLPQTLDRNHSTPSNSSPEEAGKVLEAAKARPALDPAIVEAALLHWTHCGCQHCQPNKALHAHLQQILAQDAK